MERQPIKVLFLYFGQPRLIEECAPWHDDLISYLNLHNIEVDLEYHIWDKYFNIKLDLSIFLDRKKRRFIYSDNIYNQYKPYDTNTFIDIDVNKINEVITLNRNAKCNFYSYDIMENLYDMLNLKINKNQFVNSFSQTVLKAKACQNISEHYDIVFLLRTDFIFNPDMYSSIVSFFHEFDNNSLYCDWIIYDFEHGVRSDDTKLIGEPKKLKIFYENYENKIYSYIKNKDKQYDDAHNIGINFGYYYDDKPAVKIIIKDYKPYKIDHTIVRPFPEVINYLKKISSDSYHHIKRYQRLKKTLVR